MNEDRQAWLEERAKGIGGSDVSVLFDENPWKTRQQLWEEKTGKVALEEIDNAILERGHVLEPIVADKYSQETGRMVQRRNSPYVVQDKPYIRCNVDRDILKDERGVGILEIKTANLAVYRKFIHYGLPNMYHLQLQHNLLASKRDWGAFAVFNADMWKLHHFDVDSDKEIQERIEEEIDTFWTQYVEKDIPPPEQIEEKRVELPKLGTGTIITMDSPEWSLAVQELREAKEMSDDAAALLETAKNGIKELMGDNEVCEGSGMRCYYKMGAPRKTLDKSKLQKDNPNLDLDKYMKEGKASRSFRNYEL